MANPIDNGPRINGAGISPRGRVQSGGDKTSPAPASADGAAETAASVQSSRLQQVQERIDNTPEMDMDRVEAIKQAIAEGRFPIDPQRIAQKFAELEGLLNS